MPLTYFQALSEFADYVEKQQAAHRAQTGRVSVAPSDSGYSTQGTSTEEHAELDFLDSLNLSETSGQVRLKELLLNTGDENFQRLVDLLKNRIHEGHGETMFDIGQEDNGESMCLSKDQWDTALSQIRKAASTLKADCRILMTRNVGGEDEVGALNDKETGVSGKMMIRQMPGIVEDVIETRIAVVGNGTSWNIM